MGEFNYDGSHSISFLKDGVWFDTWEDFHMAPKARPFVAEPQVKTNYIDVPGADGSLDYTEALTDSVLFGNRTGQWDFIVDLPYTVSSNVSAKTGITVTNAIAFQSAILKFFHGRNFDHIILTDELVYDFRDPTKVVDGYYYTGRITAKSSLATKDYIQITLQYNLEPYKHPIASTKNLNWKWNELFGNTIKYGTFSVNTMDYAEGSEIYGKSRTIYLDDAQNVTINVTSPMKMIYGTTVYMLNTGDNQVPMLAGGNPCTFFGHGIVTVDYSEGKVL
jgi:hypothetical protein